MHERPLGARVTFESSMKKEPLGIYHTPEAESLPLWLEFLLAQSTTEAIDDDGIEHPWD